MNKYATVLICWMVYWYIGVFVYWCIGYWWSFNTEPWTLNLELYS